MFQSNSSDEEVYSSYAEQVTERQRPQAKSRWQLIFDARHNLIEVERLLRDICDDDGDAESAVDSPPLPTQAQLEALVSLVDYRNPIALNASLFPIILELKGFLH